MNSPKERIEGAYAIISKLVEKKGSLSPMLHAYGPDGTSAVYLVAVEDKDVVSGFLHHLLIEKEFEAVLFMSEAWIVDLHLQVGDKAELEKQLATPASEHEERQEVIIFNYITRTITVHGNAPMQRDPDDPTHVTLGPLKILDDSWTYEGRFTSPKGH